MNEEEIREICKSALTESKSVFKYGFGNVIEDIQNSNTACVARKNFARAMYFECIDDNYSCIEKIVLRGQSAILANGGNCHEVAAFIYTYLRTHLKGCSLRIIKSKINIYDNDDYHVFVQVLSDNSDFDIIVDGWGSNLKSLYSLKDTIFNDKKIDILCEESGLPKEKINFEKILRSSKGYQTKQKEIKQKGENKSYLTTDIECPKLVQQGYLDGEGKVAYPINSTSILETPP